MEVKIMSMESAKNSTNRDGSILLMGHDRILRSIRRIAYQIAEDNRDASPILVAGIKQRGFVVANLLVNCLESLTEKQVEILQLPETEKNNATFKPDAETLAVDYSYIVLVDDVMFSGRTMLAAIQQIAPHFPSSKICTAVLVDRGHRSVPVKAQFIGLQLPTKLNEHVRVETDSETVKKVVLKNTSA